jgi:hypothetical protein
LRNFFSVMISILALTKAILVTIRAAKLYSRIQNITAKISFIALCSFAIVFGSGEFLFSIYDLFQGPKPQSSIDDLKKYSSTQKFREARFG